MIWGVLDVDLTNVAGRISAPDSEPGKKINDTNIYNITLYSMWYYNGISVVYRLTGPWRVVGKPMGPKIVI